MANIGDTISSPKWTYLVKNIVGSGSFGTVAVCTKVATGNQVVLKIIDNEKAIAASKNEAKFLNMMNGLGSQNFNIVIWADSFMAGKLYCMEFEWLEMNLYDYMEDNCFTLKEIRPILQQMGEALYFLKGIGLVHADLKPENIMLVDHIQEPLRVKLIDFGLAHSDPEKRRGEMLGTLAYISPEMLLGAPFSHAIDTWALGCIAVELLIGNLLIPGDNEVERLRIIASLFGQIPDFVLNFGCYTAKYYTIIFSPERSRTWCLRTISENPYPPYYIKSLKELLKVPEETPFEDVPAEQRDRASFIELITAMLNVNHLMRITPSDILSHSFLTLSHLNRGYDSYLQRSIGLMKICPRWYADHMSDFHQSVPEKTTQSPFLWDNCLPQKRHCRRKSPYFGCCSKRSDDRSLSNSSGNCSPPKTMKFDHGNVRPTDKSKTLSKTHQNQSEESTRAESHSVDDSSHPKKRRLGLCCICFKLFSICTRKKLKK